MVPGMAGMAGLRKGSSGPGHHHHAGREAGRDSGRDPADPAPFLPTPVRVSLGRREDINPYATFRLPGAGGASGPPGPAPGLSPVHRHPLQSPQHTVCMVSPGFRCVSS